MSIINSEIQNLKTKKGIVNRDKKTGDYIAGVFTRSQSIKSMHSFLQTSTLSLHCMPNGYGPAMRIFTKITKVPFSVLRMQGLTSVVYVDDSYLQGYSYESCLKSINDIK